jgi:hypothetical protein
MKLYSCKLRLAGADQRSLKADVTAAEIEVLRELHGADAVLDIQLTGEDHKTSANERARLKRIYASEESLSAQSLGRRMALLRNLFGHDRLPLPDEPVDRAAEGEGDDDEATEATPSSPVVRTRAERPVESFTE